MKIMRLKLFKNEDGSDVFSMRLSCKKHDDHFLVVCWLQGSYRALQSSAEVSGRVLHVSGMFRFPQQIFGSSSSMEVLAKVQVLWIFLFFLVSKTFGIVDPMISGIGTLCTGTKRE